MKYIPDDIVVKINELPILNVAEKLGLSVNSKRTTLCFMHNDRSPSLHFNVRKNTFYCYGCSRGGNVISLVMNRLGLSFVDAAQWLIQAYGIDVPNGRKDYRKLKISVALPKAQKVKSEYVPDVELLSWIMDVAKLSDIAKDFLFHVRRYKEDVVEQKGIKSITDANKFYKVVVDRFGLDRCKKAGIVKWNFKEYIYETVFECPCLLFPFYDERGIIYTIQGRSLREYPTNRFSFPNHSDSFIFNLQDVLNADTETPIFIAEGGTDCLALLSEGKKAIAISGAGAFKEEYIKYLKDKNLFMFADNDDSGKSLFAKIDKALRAYGNYLHQMTLGPKYKDYSEYYAEKR